MNLKFVQTETFVPGSNDSPKEHFPVQNEMHSALEQSQLAFNMQVWNLLVLSNCLSVFWVC